MTRARNRSPKEIYTGAARGACEPPAGEQRANTPPPHLPALLSSSRTRPRLARTIALRLGEGAVSAHALAARGAMRRALGRALLFAAPLAGGVLATVQMDGAGSGAWALAELASAQCTANVRSGDAVARELRGAPGNGKARLTLCFDGPRSKCAPAPPSRPACVLRWVPFSVEGAEFAPARAVTASCQTPNLTRIHGTAHRCGLSLRRDGHLARGARCLRGGCASVGTAVVAGRRVLHALPRQAPSGRRSDVVGPLCPARAGRPACHSAHRYCLCLKTSAWPLPCAWPRPPAGRPASALHTLRRPQARLTV